MCPMQGAEVKMYRYVSNRGNVAVGLTMASIPTIDFNSWVLQENSLNDHKKHALIEKLKTSKMVIRYA